MDNKMAAMLVGKLMIKMGLPIIISMMLQALYNIVAENRHSTRLRWLFLCKC